MDAAYKGESMDLVSTVEAGDGWVTQCAWSPWKITDSQTGA